MGNALVIQRSQLPQSQTSTRAAQYVRMSTDKQRYSIQNQAAVIAAYAHAHNLKIVRTYADEGESGLRIKNRAGLKQLIEDVTGGEADYGHILVYDVSRWGRFQDTDESAHYEFICKQAGVKVSYCAEQFDNDGTMLSSIVKNLKRVMAAEYSRELSVRVHAGHSRIVRLGFRPGGPIGYGLQRELVDQNLRRKGFLTRGEQKALSTDRVRVRPGAVNEIAIVKWIFEQCLKQKSDSRIARELNQGAIPSSTGRPWTPDIISRILRNENYIGNIVYNRLSRKLRTQKVINPPSLWVRGERCVEPSIESETFRRTKEFIDNRRVEMPEGEMLSRLRRTLHKKGRLSARIIDNTTGLPTVCTYFHHFGSLRNAYRLIGYTSDRDHSFIDAAKIWAEAAANLASKVAAGLKKRGRQIVMGPNDQFCIDGKTRVLFRVGRSYVKEGCLTHWRVPRLDQVPAQWIVAIRLKEDNATVLDYVLIPKAAVERYVEYMRFTERARIRLGFGRFETAEALARCIDRREVTRHRKGAKAAHSGRR